MDKETIEYFRNLLEDRLKELQAEARETVVGMTDLKERIPDPTDLASLDSDRDFTLRLRDRERKLIQKINEALKRIEDGTFGICEECGDEISFKRLQARPVTTMCIDCKREQEDLERVRGD